MTCADCNRTTIVMVEMQPDVRRQVWWLCSHCWLSSTRKAPARVVVDVKKLDPGDQQMLGVE